MADDETGPTISKLQSEIADWVERQFEEWSYEPASPTVERCSVHDFIWLEPYEVDLLNMPIVQRLGYIHQTALTFLVYRGAQHTRLEHSLGMLEVSQRMLDAIARKHPVDERVRVHVRLASLLHDTGHVLFSHLGESVLARRFRVDIQALGRERFHGRARYFDGVALGEILSYFIVTCEPFVRRVKDVLTRWGKTARGFPLVDVDLNRIGRMIIGAWDDGEERWATDIINGSFDADKLDYLPRDCHYTGIRSEIDTTRLAHSLDIVDAPSRRGTLGVRGVSINYLEQILMAKLTLYTAVYHHHKVRALECMFNAFFERLEEAGEESEFLPESLAGMFNISEADFWSKGPGVGAAGRVVRNILNRRLLKRCLVLDSMTVEEESRPRLIPLISELKDPEKQRALRSRIFDALPMEARTDVGDLWVDIPRAPDVDEEAERCPVMVAPGEVEALSTLMPANGWVRGYVTNKLRGHVFYDANLDRRRYVATAAETVLRDEYNIRLKPLARAIALKES